MTCFAEIDVRFTDDEGSYTYLVRDPNVYDGTTRFDTELNARAMAARFIAEEMHELPARDEEIVRVIDGGALVRGQHDADKYDYLLVAIRCGTYFSISQDCRLQDMAEEFFNYAEACKSGAEECADLMADDPGGEPWTFEVYGVKT